METLKERFDGLTYIIERRGDKQIIKFRGPFQEMNDIRDTKNRNGRRYTKELWEKVFADKDFQERLKSRRMLGELDHPTDNGQIRRSAIIVTDVQPDYEKGVVNGELELIDHNQGDAALLKALDESILCFWHR